MNESQKQKLNGSGGAPLKPKMRLVKGTKFVSFLFIAASILISAGFMQAANVYYDLDSSTIMVTEKQTMSGDLTVTSGNILFSTTGTITQSGSGIVSFAGNVGIGTASPTANFQVAQSATGVGTVSTPGSSTTLTGVGTQFTNTFKVGDTLTVAGETIRTIATITSNTVLDVTVAFSVTPRSAVAYTLTGGTRFSVLGSGKVGISESSGSNFTYFQGGDQSTDVTYTLPVALPGATGYSLVSSDAGVLSWAATVAGTAHDLLSASHSDTVASAVNTGDLVIGTAGGWDDLAISATSGAVLQSNGTTATWNTVLSLAGAQTADITTAAGTAPTALVFQPGANSTVSGTGASLTVKGGNETGTTSTGGNVVIQGGTGTSTNGVVQIGTANTSALTLGATGITTTNTGSLTSTQLLTASNGLTLTTGALNLTGTSGALALSGLTASSINTGAANLTFTSGNFNTTATGINTTAIGATTASTGAFTTLASSGNTTLGTGASSVNVIGSTTTPGTLTLHGATTLDNTLTVSGANLTSLGGNLSFTGTAPTISASTAATNIAIDAGTTGAVNIAGTSTGSINFAGGSGSTGCTITTAGVLTCTGNISGGGAGTRATGEAILVGLVPIFGYDYPAQTGAIVFKNVSRVIEDNPFPAATTGTTRAFKFIIRYADTLTVTQGPSLWNFYDVTTPASSIAFTVPYSPGVSLEEGTVEIVDATAGMKTLIEANGDWNLQVRPDDTLTTFFIRVYSIDLAAYDVVN